MFTGEAMQKFSLRNRCNRRNDNAIGSGNHKRTAKRDCSLHEVPPQRIQRICCRPTAAPAATVTRQSSTVKICNRIFTKESDNLPTWDEVLSVGSKSKSLLVNSNAVLVATTQEPVQQTSAKILGVPCNGTVSPHNTTNTKGNKNKDDDDDDNNRLQRIAVAASVRGFMTSERLRLGDQINFLLFDPHRTLKFLITELKSRLRTVVPDDINVQKILVEIQQTMKRIRISNATEPLLPLPSRRTTTGAAVAVECILPKERCHVIKEDPLINHARKVNSSCQTIASQMENANACQMCEHRVKQSTAGCNQDQHKNGNSNAGDVMMKMGVTGTEQRSNDHRTSMDVKKRFSCKSLQDAIEHLKIKSNPFSDDTQKIVTQLETELLNFQSELQRTSSCSSYSLHRPLEIKSTTENLKVQCKRLLEEEKGEKAEQEEGTFPDFIAKPRPTTSMYSSKLDSFTQVEATTVSKESQTNLKSSTQMFRHLENEKLLLLQQFRALEMQNIQGDLNELHVFIKDQLNDIYHSITQEDLKLKYHSNKSRKKTQKTHRTLQRPEKTPPAGQPSSSSSSLSLTALTSSILSSTELQGEVGVTSSGTSISPGHYKKSSPNLFAVDDGNANNPNSMMKQQQKSSWSSLSAADAKEHHNISDVDKANKTLGEKKSKHSTPLYSGKRNHFSAVECDGCNPHTAMDDKVQRMMTARTSVHTDTKSTRKTSPTPMTRHVQPTTAAQEQAQFISSAVPSSSYITMQSVLNPDAGTIATVRTIIENAYATTTATTATAAAAAAKHSDGIRMHKQAHNSWQRVNLKNPTGCQLKKQICGDGYECRTNNRSDYPQIHDCQKCRANSINPFGGLCSAKMHEVGADNAAASGDDADDAGAGGDGRIYCDKGNGTAVRGDFTCHTGQRKQPEKPHSRATKAEFQSDLEELKEFLDEIFLSTPRLK